jgi:DNA polymerase
MSETYHQLLDAAARHLEELKARGSRFVNVTPETLRALNGPVAARRVAPPAAVSAPAPASPVPARPAPRPPTPAPAPTVAPPVSAPPVVSAAAGNSTKAEALAALRARVLPCTKCPKLVAARTNVVFGVGNPDAALMFVGEAPGADEDAQGEPFVGAAGQLLNKMITTMGLAREQVYIANILKCRPDMPPGSSGNRKPTPEEMQTCIPYLHEQIDIIKPRVLVGLGGTAIEGLLGKTGITRLRGVWHNYRGIPIMPTYHPSYLLHNQSPAEKRRVWEDLLAVMERLGLPISDKQRGYFLPK